MSSPRTPAASVLCFMGFLSKVAPASYLTVGGRAGDAEQPKMVHLQLRTRAGLPLLFSALVPNGLTSPKWSHSLSWKEEKWAWAGSAQALIAACPAPAGSHLSASSTLPAPARLGVIGTPPAPAD